MFAQTPAAADGATDRRPGPVAPSERIDALDIIRGAALFGVFVVNTLDFAGPAGDGGPWVVSATWWDRAAELAVLVLGEGAFYSVFSFLFGVGFGLQSYRAASSGPPTPRRSFRRTYARRMLILAAIGLLHHVLLWENDILVPYAFTGLVLLAFHRRSASTRRRWLLGLAGLCVVAVGATVAAAIALEDLTPSDRSTVEAAAIARHAGGFAELAAARLDDLLPLGPIALVVSLPWFLTLFLAGVWAVDSGRVEAWRDQGDFARRALRFLVPVAVVAKGTFALLIVTGEEQLATLAGPLLSLIVGGPALGATWLCLALLALIHRGALARRLATFAPVGRMALTNYLTQSLVATTIFNGYGLGLYGRYGVAATTLWAVGFFGLQIISSRWWLARYRFGPAEWLWRQLTYGTYVRLRRPALP